MFISPWASPVLRAGSWSVSGADRPSIERTVTGPATGMDAQVFREALNP